MAPPVDDLKLGALLNEDDDLLPAPAPAALPRVVIVDDDWAVRRALELLLRELYTLHLCSSAQEGVAAVDAEVCCVILDVRMKGHDGFWACDEIRKRHPDVPVIFYSAYQDAKDPYQIINEHRPFGYLTKDGDSRKLLETVSVAVRLFKITLDNKRLVESIKNHRRAKE